MERMKMNDLKILYRGDIDEAPEGTNVVQLSERTWATGRSGTLKTIAPSDFATEFWQSNPVYQLIRALCLSAEQEERLSGVWIGDGDKRVWHEVRVTQDIETGAVSIELAAPAPKEPEWEVEIIDDKAARFIQVWRKNKHDKDFPHVIVASIDRGSLGFMSEPNFEILPHEMAAITEWVTRKGEQDGK